MEPKQEKKLLDNLRIMEIVETELQKQKNDAVLSLVTFLSGTSVWVLLIALWEKLGEPIAPKRLTIGVEVIAVLMLIYILKFTRLDIRKMGITRKRWKNALCRGGIISAVIVAIMVVLKLIMKPGQPILNFAKFDPLYAVTSVLQEFLARGFLLTCLMNIINFKHSESIAVITSSLLFTTLHLYYGFLFMVGAGILSILLGYVYLKDKNIWGVALIHFCFGLAGVMMELV